MIGEEDHWLSVGQVTVAVVFQVSTWEFQGSSMEILEKADTKLGISGMS